MEYINNFIFLGRTNEEFEDEADPEQCHYFSQGKCKFKDRPIPKSKKGTDQLWIQCDLSTCRLWYHLECVELSFSSRKEQEDFIFNCPMHTSLAYRAKYAIQKSDMEREVRPISEITASLAHHRKNEIPADRPNYVEYDGNVYHIARFLSLQCMKTYTPMSSRKERWKSSNMDNYFDNIRKQIGDIKESFPVFFTHKPNKETPREMKLGVIVRIVKRYSAKSAAILLSGQGKDIKQLEFFVLLSNTNNEMKPSSTHLLVSGRNVIKIMPQFEIEGRDEAKRIFNGLPEEEIVADEDIVPESMTVVIMKRVLRKNNISFKSNERRASLLLKVKSINKSSENDTNE